MSDGVPLSYARTLRWCRSAFSWSRCPWWATAFPCRTPELWGDVGQLSRGRYVPCERRRSHVVRQHSEVMSVSCLVVERLQQHQAQFGRRRRWAVDGSDADVEERTWFGRLKDCQAIAGYSVRRTVDVRGRHQWKQVLGRCELRQCDGDALLWEHRSIVVDVHDDQLDSYHLEISGNTISAPIKNTLILNYITLQVQLQNADYNSLVGSNSRYSQTSGVPKRTNEWVQGGPKNLTVLRVDNFAKVSGRKTRDMSTVFHILSTKCFFETCMSVNFNILCPVCINLHYTWNYAECDNNVS